MASMDEWLLTRVFEPIAWKIESLSNLRITNFSIARYILVVWPTATVTYAIGPYATMRMWANFCAVLVVPASIALYYGILQNERSVQRGHINPWRSSFYMLMYRVCCCSTFLGMIMGYFSGLSEEESPLLAVSVVGIVLCLYFGACNSLPPWYRKFNERAAVSAG